MITSIIYECTHVLFFLHLSLSSCFVNIQWRSSRSSNWACSAHPFPLEVAFLIRTVSSLGIILVRLACEGEEWNLKKGNNFFFLQIIINKSLAPLLRFEPRTSCSVVHCYWKSFSGVFKRGLVLFSLNNFSRFLFFLVFIILPCYS